MEVVEQLKEKKRIRAMFEVKEKVKGKGWRQCKEIGLREHSFNSIEEAQAEIEVFMFNLESSFLDGYLKIFDEKAEREGLGIFNIESGQMCHKSGLKAL